MFVYEMVPFPTFIFLGELLRLLRCDLAMLSKFYSVFGICVANILYCFSLVLKLLIQICLFILWSSFLPGFSRVSPSILLKMVYFLEKWKKAPGVLNISARKKSRINGILGKRVE